MRYLFNTRTFFVALMVALSAPLGWAQQVDNATLKPGDAVRITVWRQPELTGEFVVGPDGTIAHPVYKEVNVNGRPWATVENNITTVLKRFESAPQFVAIPLLRIGIGGEVRQPGSYNLPVGTTVIQAIAQAGGFSERARTSKVRIRRGTQEVILDLTGPTDAAATVIQSGDQIVVNTRTSVFRDVIVPFASVAAATASIVNIILN